MYWSCQHGSAPARLTMSPPQCLKLCSRLGKWKGEGLRKLGETCLPYYGDRGFSRQTNIKQECHGHPQSALLLQFGERDLCAMLKCGTRSKCIKHARKTRACDAMQNLMCMWKGDCVTSKPFGPPLPVMITRRKLTVIFSNPANTPLS